MPKQLERGTYTGQASSGRDWRGRVQNKIRLTYGQNDVSGARANAQKPNDVAIWLVMPSG